MTLEDGKDSGSCDQQNRFFFFTSALDSQARLFCFDFELQTKGRRDGRVPTIGPNITTAGVAERNTNLQLKVRPTDQPPVLILTSVWLRPAGAQSYVVVLKVGSLRDTTGLVTIIRFLLYSRRPPPPLTLAVKWEQGESASRRPICWSSSMSLPGAWSTVLQPQVIQAFLRTGGGEETA